MNLPLILLFSLTTLSVSARSSSDKSILSVISFYDSTIHSSISGLLPLYFDLKNALVHSDAATASVKAGKLLDAINRVDTRSLDASQLKIFISLQSKLSYDARHIAEVQKIEHQREHFVSLSNNMYILAKSIRFSDKPIYRDYCPMKKAYWLSEEKEIKNPYYVNQMPDCGDITNTLN